jgi:sulfate adenylyltransferase subunit 1
VLWGRVAQGELQAGDQVQVFPSGETARVREVRHPNRSQPQQGHTQAGESAGVVLDRPLDVSRGDWLAARGYLHGTREFTATLAWLDTEPAVIGRKFLLRHGNQWVQARLATIEQRLDIESLQRHPSARLQVNDIGEVRFELQNPLPLLPFAQSRMGGALVLVDPSSHRTSAAVLVTAVQ